MVKIIIIILNKLLSNEQVVQKLADSYPMRRAAQLIVYFLNKGKHTALEFKNVTQLDSLNLTEKLKKLVEELEKQNRRLK